MSRRMWSRRLLRAGWLLAPIFAAPGKTWRWFKNIQWHKIDVGFSMFVTIMIIMSVSFAYFLATDAERRHEQYANATGAELKAAANDPCIGGQIAARLKEGYVVRRFDIEQYATRCANGRALQQQIEALK